MHHLMGYDVHEPRGKQKNERTGGSHGIQDHGKNGKYEERAEYGGEEDRERPGEDQ